MTRKQNFEEFLTCLHECDRFPVSEALPPEVCFVDKVVTGFVPPNLAVSEEADPTRPVQALIISAPGAVGKSTLGQAVAAQKKALFWDLAKSGAVGDRSLDGMLFGITGDRTNEYLEYLSHGYQLLVIDALDEGNAKAGNESAFRSFLGNVAARARGADGICFVLLGRKQISVDAWCVLTDAGVNAVVYTIEPFSRQQANQYIENHLCPEARTEPVLECRDLISERLAFSVTGDMSGDSAHDFLHYPPVLDVVSTLLNEESNPMTLKNELSREPIGAGDTPFALLQDVIERILVREKEKFLPIVQERLNEKADQLDWGEWDSLYRPHEQCQRLVGSFFRMPVTDKPSNIPDALRLEYEDAVDDFSKEHPFLQGESDFANQVFEAYLYARALHAQYGVELKRAVQEMLSRPGRLPNRLLAEFYLGGTQMDTQNNIEAAHLGIVYDSLLSADSDRSHLRLIIDGPEPGDPLDIGPIEGVFEFVAPGQVTEDVMIYPINFVLDISESQTISFSRTLRNAFITFPGTVSIGNQRPDFRIGPAVEMHIQTLQIGSQSLTVGGPTILRPDEKDDNSVIIEADGCEAPFLTGRPNVYEKQDFFVRWEDSHLFPWREYPLPDLEDDPGDGEQLTPVYHRFKAIARTFRSHGRGQLARTNQKIDDWRVMKGPVGEQLLRQLIDDGIVHLRGQRYFWIPERADAQLGVSWQHIRQGQIPDTLKRYLARFISEHEALFV